MVSGATLKSRNQKQTPSNSARARCLSSDVRPVPALRIGSRASFCRAYSVRSHQLNAEDIFVGYGAALPPAAVPPPTILCRLRSEKAYCGSGGRGFDSRHLQERLALT